VEIAEQDHLVIASVNRAEAADRAWKRADVPVDIVRLTDSADVDEETLAEWGFIARPRWVNWCAPLRGSEDEFEAALSTAERRDIRRARRFAEREDLRVDLRVGLTPELMDEFLVVYDRQIAEMPRGKDFARRSRERLLDAAADHIAVSLYAGDTMVVGSVWWVRPEQSVLQLRFSAAAAGARAGGVMRVAYARALRFARDNGLEFASLGNDPSLFGHVVQPGLFDFKSRRGFAPVPAQVLEPRLDGEFADIFLTLRSLTDPALVLTWGGRRGKPLAWPDAVHAPEYDLLVLSTGADPALADRFRPPGCRRTRVVTVPSVPW
jgi:hypothetical protein